MFGTGGCRDRFVPAEIPVTFRFLEPCMSYMTFKKVGQRLKNTYDI